MSRQSDDGNLDGDATIAFVRGRVDGLREPDQLTVLGSRIRAALCLADMDANELAVELNISGRTLHRTLVGLRAPRPWEIRRINELLELPEWFLRDGLRRPRELDETADDGYHAQRVEEKLDDIAGELRALRDDLESR